MLPFLQVLNLDFCTLSELPPSLGQLTALTTLDVEGNPYLGDTFRPDNLMMPPAFPLELSGLRALKYINLNSCGLTSVPEVGFDCLVHACVCADKGCCPSWSFKPACL